MEGARRSKARRRIISPRFAKKLNLRQNASAKCTRPHSIAKQSLDSRRAFHNSFFRIRASQYPRHSELVAHDAAHSAVVRLRMRRERGNDASAFFKKPDDFPRLFFRVQMNHQFCSHRGSLGFKHIAARKPRFSEHEFGMHHFSNKIFLPAIFFVPPRKEEQPSSKNADIGVQGFFAAAAERQVRDDLAIFHTFLQALKLSRYRNDNFKRTFSLYKFFRSPSWKNATATFQLQKKQIAIFL